MTCSVHKQHGGVPEKKRNSAPSFDHAVVVCCSTNHTTTVGNAVNFVENHVVSVMSRGYTPVRIQFYPGTTTVTVVECSKFENFRQWFLSQNFIAYSTSLKKVFLED